MGNKNLFKFSIIMITFAVIVIVIQMYNLREVGIKQGLNKANVIAQIIENDLINHMINNTYNEKNKIIDAMLEINSVKNIWITKSNSVIKQYGANFDNKYADHIDKLTLNNGKTNFELKETILKAMLRVSIPFKNNDKCKSCHISNFKDETLGVVSLNIDMSEFKDSGFTMALLIIFITLISIVILIYMLNKLIEPYTYTLKILNNEINLASKGIFKNISIKNKNLPLISINIIEKYNDLSKNLNDIFLEIDLKLRSFIGYSNKEDIKENPLLDSRNTIIKLSYIYEFKQQIQLDKSKEEVYARICDIFKNKFFIKYVNIFEVDENIKIKKVYSLGNKDFCYRNIENDAYSCRAYKNEDDVSSLEFQKVCNCFDSDEKLHYCIETEIGKSSKMIMNFIFNTSLELEEFNKEVSFIKAYIKEIAPIVSFYSIFEELEDIAFRDELTGLYNRKFFNEYITKIIPIAKRDKFNIGFLMLDLDRFKAVNDEYGHDIGDNVLKEFSKCVLENIRESDILIRFGGEEFIVLLVNIKNDDEAIKVANKIRQNVSLLEIDAYAGSTIRKTTSIGVSMYPKDSTSFNKVMKLGDIALYEAKNSGRNKVVRYKEKVEEIELF